MDTKALANYVQIGHFIYMKLADYLKNNNLTCQEFADRLDVANATTVHRYAIGIRIPRPEIMQRIVEETRGEVTAADFYPSPEKKRRSREVAATT